MAFEAPTLEREEGADGEAAPKKARQEGMSDADILSMLAAEKGASIGFENGTELERKRKQALEYSKGEMTDIPSLANRSKAVTTDVEDTIQTILPVLMDIFTGGEDVASFAPVGPDDEERAQQETDWVLHVAFTKLPGFLLLYEAIKDALQVDTGVLKTWWQDNAGTEDEEVEGKSAVELEMATKAGAELAEPATPAGATPDGVPLFNATLRKSYDKGCIRSASIDPSNISVAQDATLDLKECIYFVIRSYPRAQSLLDQGFDKNKVAELGAYSPKTGNEQTEQARDVAGETTSQAAGTDGASGPEGPDGKSLQRTVEVHEHFIRADIDLAGKSQLWKIQTDSQCKVILHKKKVDRHGISVGTPFIIGHRFYGMSVAEKMVQIQQIKTALWRLLLDSGYFALNQRMEVAEDQATENTIPDLMRNEPLVPVRSKNGQAVRPLQAGQLGFDAAMTLELASVMGESRSGSVRNAQGINPDTLHDTASGAKALMSMAQTRIRMIARVLAETLVKGWFLDIHSLSRAHNTRAEKTNLRGKWVDVNPSSFGDRDDMVVEVGVGAGGKEMELAIIDRVMALQEKIVQSGISDYASMVPPQQVWNAVARFCTRGGLKSPETFFANPQKIAEQEAQAKAEREAQGIPEPQPPPSPEVMKVQGELELQSKRHQDTMALETEKTKAKFAMDQQSTQAKAQSDQQAAMIDAQQRQAQSEAEMTLKREQAAADMQLRREQMAAENNLKREQMLAEIELKRQQLNAELQMNMQLEQMKIAAGVYTKTQTNTTDVHPGGEAGA